MVIMLGENETNWKRQKRVFEISGDSIPPLMPRLTEKLIIHCVQTKNTTTVTVFGYLILIIIDFYDFTILFLHS